MKATAISITSLTDVQLDGPLTQTTGNGLVWGDIIDISEMLKGQEQFRLVDDSTWVNPDVWVPCFISFVTHWGLSAGLALNPSI